MKKRLLLTLIVVLSVCGIHAYDKGGYYYSESARWKVVSDNLLTNGDFSKGLDGLVNDAGDPVTNEFFTVLTGGGPGGLNCLQAVEPGAMGTGGFIHMQEVITNAGYYLVTFKVKSDGAQRTITNNKENSTCIGVFRNSDGSLNVDATAETGNNGIWVTPQPSGWHYEGEWKELGFVTLVADGDPAAFFNVIIGNFVAGDCIADMGIYQLQKVDDDRVLRSFLGRVDEFYENETDFPKNREMITSAREMLMEMIAGFEQDNTIFDMEGTVESLVKSMEEEAFVPFLDSNSVDMSGYFTNFGFDDGITGYSKSGLSDPKGVEAKEALGFGTPFFRVEINSDWALAEGDLWQEVDLPAGRYMYRVKGAGNWCYRIDGNNKTGVVLGDSVSGMGFFLNSDTLWMEHVSPTWAKEYTLYSTVEDGEKVRIGFHSPAGPNKKGGSLKWDNIEIRLIGGATQEQVDEYFYANKVRASREKLTAAVDSAKALVASPRYLYGKDNLNKGIADGENVLKEFTASTEEVNDTLTRQLKTVGDSISAFYVINAEYTTLGDNIAAAEEAHADATRPAGKDALLAAINTAREFYNAQTAEVRDSAGLADHSAALLKAVDGYYAVNAGYNTPGQVTVVNPNFADKGNGWDIELDGESKQQLKYGSDESFSGGTKVYANRGTTTGPKNLVTQTVTLNYNGMYELEFEAYAKNTGKYNGQITDTVNVFFTTQLGEGRTDSVMIHTAEEKAVKYMTRVFVTDAPVDLTFGLNSLNNVDQFASDFDGSPFATSYGFGGNKITFYGDYDKYVKDSIAAVIQPMRDSLQQAIDAASHLKSTARLNGVSADPFTAVIAAAQGVKDDANSTLEQIEAQFPALEKGSQDFMISGVWPAEGEYFDLSFLIKNADFTDETADFFGWTMEGQPFGLNENPGDLSLYYAKEFESFSSSLTQKVENMPEGKYQLVAYATYRYGLYSEFTPDNYKNNTVMFISVDGNRTPVTGLLATGQLNDDGSWGLDAGNSFTLDDYRHARGAWEMINAGHYRNAMEFEVGDAKSATVGFVVENIPSGSNVFMRTPRIHFWGDTVADGIGSVVSGGTDGKQRGDVYTLSGVKVRSGATSLDGLAKGVYIMNGKKYVVR